MNDQLAGQVLEALNDKVDIDYGNMPANSTNYAPSSKNVTNCITEIPQDIKLELTDGTLTLKAGSKVYVPNGFEDDGTTVKFDEVVVESDLTTTSSVNTQIILFYKSDGTLGATTLASATSGTSQPAGNGYWYDTINNIIKRIVSGAVESSGHSFPFAIVNCNSTEITSIDQVFNGFGYIGSTIFALPGVKGLIPNGRNEDGSLKNIEFVSTNVAVRTLSFSVLKYLGFNGKYIGLSDVVHSGYDKLTNTNYSADLRWDFCLVGFVSINKGMFSIKQPFASADCNDTEFIAHQTFPSNKYIDLTLGATDSYYTASSDGWFFISKNLSANQYLNGYIVPDNATTRIVGVTKLVSASGAAAWTLPVSKGQRLFLTYTASGTTNYFRFIYANGSK